jgi:hypothetical protein
MPAYRYPYLETHQSRTQEPTPWQKELASTLESVFGRGAHDLDAVVAGLNGSRVRPPGGGDWTPETFTRVMHELGA